MISLRTIAANYPVRFDGNPVEYALGETFRFFGIENDGFAAGNRWRSGDNAAHLGSLHIRQRFLHDLFADGRQFAVLLHGLESAEIELA